MKRHAGRLWGVVRLAVGVAIVAVLLYRIDRGSVLVEFTTAPVSVSRGALYGDHASPQRQFLVLKTVSRGTAVAALLAGKTDGPVGDTGRLVLIEGDGPAELAWSSRRSRHCGLVLLGRSFRSAAANWPWLAAGFMVLLGSFAACTIRWKLILAAQGLFLSWRQTGSIFMIGHFFNSFMFGATGGDLVKAYYAARETHHKKTEAVTTVFIDRLVGLLSIVLFAGAIMLTRIRFFLSHPETRYAFIVVVGAAIVFFAGLAGMLVLRPLLRRFRFAQRLGGTRAGQAVQRVYMSFFVCLTRPGLLFKTIALSCVNFLALLSMMYLLGKALLIDATFADYLALGPTINVIACLPVTPGGLGVREYAMVIYLGVVGVPAVKSLPLSVMMYVAMLLWSLVGGIVFLFHTSGADRAEVLAAAVGDQ